MIHMRKDTSSYNVCIVRHNTIHNTICDSTIMMMLALARLAWCLGSLFFHPRFLFSRL